ncbi:hypothetical protein V1L54_23390 [Streptomyces sp. TRM 70361]|uniref:hypothetical protein n=1 Tax=Streptomyces sp. TRM 70361 TaxID=3116553 RepID=UPI002E7B656C|nr:hypothetical protein [Streptomyces sp. TRM 70361]MEE1942309.1 hypothetical protein [Streptomyces sp. TRM 70361]
MTHDRATENDQLYRYEITAALNAVVRACADIVRDHSHRGFWTPHTTTDQATHQDLIEAARKDVLNHLQMVIQCAETVAQDIEHDRQRQPNRPTE